MSYRKMPYRDKDKRSMILEKESEKLRREISELEDALILHSRFEKEKDQSVRGLIRKEIGGSRWEHGGEGKLRTYRSQKDLQEETHGNSKRNGRETQQTKKTRKNEGKIQNSKELAFKTKVHKSHLNVSPSKQSQASSKKSEKASPKADIAVDLEISSFKADWNSSLREENPSNVGNPLIKGDPDLPVNIQEGNSIKDLKSRVLAKATAKILNKSDFLKTSSTPKEISPATQKGSHKNKMVSDSHQLVTSSRQIHPGRDKRAKDYHDPGNGKERVSKSNENKCPENNEPSFFQKSFFPAVEGSNFYGKEQHSLSYFSEKDSSIDNTSGNSVNFNKSDSDPEHKKATNEHFQAPRPPYSPKNTFPESPYRTTLDISSKLNDNILSEKMFTVQSVSNGQKEDSDDVKPEGSISDQIDENSPHLDKEVYSWLETLDLHSTKYYIDLFAHHQMDMASIKLLTATQLREMGIHALGPIMKIMKGVQILGRRNSKDDGQCHLNSQSKNEEVNDLKPPSHKTSKTAMLSTANATCENDNVDDSFHQRSKDRDLSASVDEQQKPDERSRQEICVKPQRPASLSGAKGEKALNSTQTTWKETFEEAEFLNLQDRSPIADLETPLLVSVKGSKESNVKNQTSHKKTKTRTTGSKTSKKPPTSSRVVDDGISLASQRNSEKHRHQHQQGQAEERARARRKEMRDEMAAKHHVRRRSVSMERESSASARKPALQRSSSFNNKTKRKDIDQFKDLPDESLKSQDDNNTLTLGVVRELKKQLNDLEQHLVNTQDDDDLQRKVNDLVLHGDSIHEALKDSDIPGTNDSLDNAKKEPSSGRRSARERRRNKLEMSMRESNIIMSSMNITPLPLTSEIIGASNEKNQAFSKTTNTFSAPVQSVSDTKQSVNILNVNENAKSAMYSSSKKSPLSVTGLEPKVSKINVDKLIESNSNNFRSANDVSQVDLQVMNSPYKALRMSTMSKLQNVGCQDQLRKIEIDNQDVSFEKKDLLGEGVFSQVFKGKYQGSQVAVKLLRAPLLATDKNYFFAEVSLLQELRHPHVVMLLGVCSSSARPIMVLELMEGGNLFSRLHNDKLSHLSKSNFYQIAHDVASGISYLHHHRPPVLHLDLKSRNILLGYGNRAKVADFGFSKLKHEADIKISRASKPRALSGSPAWMAPELLDAGEITAKADVYSFAIVLWEMITRQHPYDGFSMFQVLEHVRLSRRPQLPSGYPHEIIQLITKCWEQNPAARPGFKVILKSLDSSVSNLELMIWPNESNQKENVDKVDASLKINSERKGDNSALNKMEKIDKDHEDSDDSILIMDNMDIRSISSEDMDNLRIEDDSNLKKVSNYDKQERKEQSNDEEDLRLQKDFHDASDNESNISGNSLLIKSREFTEVMPFASPSPSSPLCVTDLSSSPRLIPSPRIREMAKKQAVERSSSVFLDHSTENKSEVGSDSSQSLRAAAYQSEDSELETLIQKYLPSPRNKTLIKQVNAAHHSDTTGRLLPLRQSLDNKPQKPPKPRKTQRMSPFSQSLNFDHSSVPPKRTSQPENYQIQPLKEKPNIPHVVKKQNKQEEFDEGLSKVVENDSFEVENVVRGTHSGSFLQKSLPSFQSSSSHAKSSPRQENLRQSLHVLETSTQDMSTKGGDRLEPTHPVVKTSKPVINIPQKVTTQNSPSTPSPLPNSEESTNIPAKAKPNSADNNIIDNYPPEMESSKDGGDDLENHDNSSLNVSEQEKKDFEGTPKSLPFLSELKLKGKTSNTEKDRFSIDENMDHFSGSVGINARNSSFHSEKDSEKVSKMETSPRPETNINLTGLDQSGEQLDLQKEVYFDRDSSRSSEFSADSLSLSLSDDLDSVDSIEFTDSGHKIRNSLSLNVKSKNKAIAKKAKSAHASKEIAERNTSSLPITKAQQCDKLQGNVMRESFFLFDDFQLTRGAKSQMFQNDDLSKSHILNTSVDRMFQKPSEKSSDPNSLDVVGVKVNSMESVSQQHQVHKKHGKNSNFKERKFDEQMATAQISMPSTNENKTFKKSGKSNPVIDKKTLPKPKWSTPHISNEEPEVRPPRNLLFSLEASMLVKQKGQLKSVTVQGQPPLIEMKKEGKRHMPSVESILKKAIEGRRFAMGDHMESQSQDMTPDASWSIQEDDV